MKKPLQIFSLVFFCFFTISFNSKDFNEYGKWLNYYELKDEDFVKTIADKKMNIKWSPYELSSEQQKEFSSFYFFSEDSKYFLDLHSYNLIIETDSAHHSYWLGNEPDQKIQLVNKKDLSSATLLFCGIDEYAETAIWRNKNLFEIFGFNCRNNIFIPTVWKFNLSKKQ